MGSRDLNADENLDFEVLFQFIPGLYLILTPQLKIVAVSDAYLKATMTKRQNILGRGLFEVFPDNPNDPSATGTRNLKASLERVLKNKTPDTMAVQQYDIRRPEGGDFEVRYWSPVNCPVFKEGTREILYIIHRVEDVTEFIKLKNLGDEKSKKMEAEIFSRSQELQEANKKLISANEELEAFSYSVSHDLRTPLRQVNAMVSMVQEDAGESLNPDAKRNLNLIADSAKRMSQLVDDLLAFSKSAREEMKKTKVPTFDMAQDLQREISATDKSRVVEWKISALPEVEADPNLLRQVFMNLMCNAFKYTRDAKPAKIEVECKDEKGEWIFSVRDNGAGFDMKHVEKLFGVFQRLHTKEQFEGTGIGLANVKRIITRHGGRTWAESFPGGGAVFYFSLPR